MAALLIVGLIVLLYGMFDSAKMKCESIDRFIANRGSCQVEKEEWERWTRQLYEEYSQLSGMEKNDFESMDIDPFNVEIRYGELYASKQLHWKHKPHDIFGEEKCRYDRFKEIPIFTDKNILEKLRVRHGLPSDD